MNLNDDDKKKAVDMAAGMAGQFSEKDAEKFADEHQGKSWYQNFRLLLDMLKDPDFKLSKKHLTLIAGALVYVAMPIDLIPDFLPGAGWVDDLALISYVVYLLSDEVTRYKIFKNEAEE